MLQRDQWSPLAQKLDWTFRYVQESEVYPPEISGTPWLPQEAWRDWDEPFRTSFKEYVITQSEKDASVYAVRDALGRTHDLGKDSSTWINSVKLHSATLPLAEFAAVVGCLRAGRFGRDGAWRRACTFAALDELRHTQIPLLLMHELIGKDPQFEWTHSFYHSNNWVALAARHMSDELLVASNPIEFAIATNFVFETGFTNLQFVALSSLAHEAGDTLFEEMNQSIQSDEARHALIGHPVLHKVMEHDRDYAQYLLDKWFWRSWRLFAIVTGFSMDYLTPLERRTCSFKEFTQEWIIDQYLRSIAEFGLERPWYWEEFLDSLDCYHHMVYAAAYTYRATVWFDMALPGPAERAWLGEKYPKYWGQLDPVWTQVSERWQASDPGNDFAVHSSAIVSFCELCQLVLCGGTPGKNGATTLEHDGEKYIFCSAPCRWIFERETARYAGHRGLVKRVLAGEAPANLVEMVRKYFGLDYETWGKDASGGRYPWLVRAPKPAPSTAKKERAR